MNTYNRSREVEKPKPPKQMSVASLPAHKQDAAMDDCDRASEQYPSVLVADDVFGLHVFETGGEWQVWLNCEYHDFTGLCVSVGRNRDQAVAAAVAVLEATLIELQKAPA